MSPLWLERADIVLAAGSLELARVDWLGRARAAPLRLAIEPQASGVAGGPIWQAALDGLGQALAGQRPALARVRLSGRFCRFALAPWNPGLTPGEERALAHAIFLETYGDAALGWEVRIDNLKRGAALVACAVDAELVAGLARTFAAAGWRLGSLEPLLAAALARAAPEGDGEPEASWYALLEADWCSAALIDGESFLATCGIPLTEPAAVVAQALQSENVRLAREVRALRLLPGSLPLRSDAGFSGWQVGQA